MFFPPVEVERGKNRSRRDRSMPKNANAFSLPFFSLPFSQALTSHHKRHSDAQIATPLDSGH